MPVTAGALAASAALNAGVGLACLVAFAVVRAWPATANLYQAQRVLHSDDAENSHRGAKRSAPELPQGFLAWVAPVWRCKEQDIISLCGLDVACYCRMLGLGMRLFTYITLWTCVVVLPINYSVWDGSAAGNSIWNTSSVASTDIDLLSLSNVPPGSPLMWVHIVSTYVITILALKLLWDCSRDVAFLRAVFLAGQPRVGPSSTVLVTDVPGLDHGTPAQKVKPLRWLQSLAQAGWGGAAASPAAACSEQQQRWPLPPTSTAAAGRGCQGAGHGACDAPDDVPSGLEEPLLLPVSCSATSRLFAGRGFLAGPMEAPGAWPDGQQLAGGAADVVQDPWREAVEQLQASNGDVKCLVDQEMRHVYGQDSVVAVATVHDIGALQPVAAVYQQLLQEFEDVLDWYATQLQLDHYEAQTQQAGGAGGSAGKHGWGGRGTRGPQHLSRKVTVVGARFGPWGVQEFGVAPVRLEALAFYPQVLQHQWRLVAEEQQHALRRLPLPAAFVTFKGQLMASLAASSLHCLDETCWRIRPAPRPQEVVWASLGLRAWEVSLRHLAVWLVFVLLVLFYLPITAFIQAPVNMDNMRKVPFFAFLLDVPWLSQLIQGFLPSLVLLLFLTVLPYLLTALITFGRPISLSELDTQLVQKYFLFQLFAVFIFSFISGTALGQLEELVQDPGAIVPLLGIAAPQQASFFMTYLLLIGCIRAPVLLLALPQLALYLLKAPFAATRRQQRRLLQEQTLVLGQHIPMHTLALLLGLVFCVAAPLIAPIALLYFAVTCLTQRYQLLYMFRVPFEGAGQLWVQLFHQVMVAVYVFIAVMGSLLGIKRFPYAVLMLPLALGALVFHVLASTWLARPLQLPPSREAAAMDRQQAASGGAPGRALVGAGQQAAASGLLAEEPQGAAAGVEDLYLPPALLLHRGDLDELLLEAEQVKQQLAGHGLQV